jgi:plastocyanin
MTHRPLCVALVAAGLTLAGCGGGESSKGGYRSGPSSKGHTGGAAPAPTKTPAGASTATVTMADIAFKPDRLTVHTGQSVQWNNEDGVPHTVKAQRGDDFESKILQPGQHYRVQLGRPGQVAYVCTIHPNMKATIRVEK